LVAPAPSKPTAEPGGRPYRRLLLPSILEARKEKHNRKSARAGETESGKKGSKGRRSFLGVKQNKRKVGKGGWFSCCANSQKPVGI
jgi:hypothetical protein